MLLAKPRPHLGEFTPLPPDRAPLVSIVLPARNEERTIGRCLRSLLASEYPACEILVIDDRSTDATAALVAGFAASDQRVRLIHGTELPAGWYGKPWACWQGAQQAKGELLLFTDADTEHGPQLLPRAVAALQASDVDLVTVMPRQEMIGFWERMVQPFFFLLLGLRFGPLSRINRNRNPRHGIANGQFILVTRQSYFAVGGHQAVHNTVLDDLMMGVRYLEARRTHLFVNAEDDMTTRMYDSLGGIIEGWSKNAFMGVWSTMRSRPLAYVGILGAALLPLMSLAPVALLVCGAVRGSTPLLLAGGAWYALHVLLHAAFLVAARSRVSSAVFYPLGALVMLYILLRSTVRGSRHIVWRGRSYSHP